MYGEARPYGGQTYFYLMLQIIITSNVAIPFGLINFYTWPFVHSSLPIFRWSQNSKAFPCNRPWRPIGLWDVKDPTLSRQSAHRWRLGCQPYASAALYPPERLVISVGSSVNPRVIVRLKGLGKLKTSVTAIGTQTRDLPVCSIAPQSSTLPREK
jgi:hypothetical protein